MNKLILFILALLFVFKPIFGQTEIVQKDELLFEKGLLLEKLAEEDLNLNRIIYHNTNVTDKLDTLRKIKLEYALEIKREILKEAHKYYQELVDSFPSSRLMYASLNNKGFIELFTNDSIVAKKTFLGLLNCNVSEFKAEKIVLKKKVEPSTNYKNTAAKILMRMALSDSNYNLAIQYLDSARKYKYQYWCGNMAIADKLFMSRMYASCYVGLKEYKKAYELLLPHIFDNEYTNNSELVILAYETLLKLYDRDYAKDKYREAFNNYGIETITRGTYRYENYCIKFFDIQIEFSPEMYSGNGEEAKQIEAFYVNTLMYKLLNEKK